MTLSETNKDPDETLAQRADELNELREFIDTTTFSGDERELTGEVTVVDNHPGDTAGFAFQRELMETSRQIIDQEAKQVHDAQERLAEGSYGICAECGKPISPERLAARPSATRCIECQRGLESRAA
jgi:RNA polymerase-binding transcription factor DksA